MVLYGSRSCRDRCPHRCQHCAADIYGRARQHTCCRSCLHHLALAARQLRSNKFQHHVCRHHGSGGGGGGCCSSGRGCRERDSRRRSSSRTHRWCVASAREEQPGGVQALRRDVGHVGRGAHKAGGIAGHRQLTIRGDTLWQRRVLLRPRRPARRREAASQQVTVQFSAKARGWGAGCRLPRRWAGMTPMNLQPGSNARMLGACGKLQCSAHSRYDTVNLLLQLPALHTLPGCRAECRCRSLRGLGRCCCRRLLNGRLLSQRCGKER